MMEKGEKPKGFKSVLMETISAIATPQGRGGIAVVRMSGDGALAIARKMFSRKGEYEPARFYVGEIDCGAFTDHGGCLYFRAPRSFTGEDVVEFHCHGGTEIARGVLMRTIGLGARLAERGEFTKRAFLNGKLSLSAAEGMIGMINAQSEAQVRAGYLLYRETLTEEGKRVQGLLKECLARTDADLDYPEEDLGADVRAEVIPALREAARPLERLASQYRAGKKVKSGVRVAICGKPNAGKSTLFNALLGTERAIVSDIAGTTRDTLEGEIELHGVLFRLVDTAGLRESGDRLEQEGVRRARLELEGADVVVWLKEGEDPPALGVPVIVVGAKHDIRSETGCDVLLSARTGEGMERLRELLYERGYGRENEGAFVLEERHYSAVTRALEGVKAALRAAEEGLPAELYAEEMRRAWSALGEISGETATEAIVSEIFEKFCVGK